MSAYRDREDALRTKWHRLVYLTQHDKYSADRTRLDRELCEAVGCEPGLFFRAAKRIVEQIDEGLMFLLANTPEDWEPALPPTEPCSTE